VKRRQIEVSRRVRNGEGKESKRGMKGEKIKEQNKTEGKKTKMALRLQQGCE
jgi:hypothetical protein